MTTTAQLSENSHQGFDGIKATLCLGLMEAKSNTASGMPVCLWREGIGSRSTGKERDVETGLDYFLARYYSGAQGRFLSVDPENAGASRGNPQSWNAYSYALNNPLRYVDPTGMSSILYWGGSDWAYVDGVAVSSGIASTWLRNDAAIISSEPRYQWDASENAFKGIVINANGNASYDYFGPLPEGEVSSSFTIDYSSLKSNDDSTLPATGAIEDASFELWSTLSAVKGLASMGRSLFKSVFKVAASTGRTEALNLTEQLAMRQAKSNPHAGTVVRLKEGVKDVRWPASKGWVKMTQYINGVEIHYVRNKITGAVADFKFK